MSKSGGDWSGLTENLLGPFKHRLGNEVRPAVVQAAQLRTDLLDRAIYEEHPVDLHTTTDRGLGLVVCGNAPYLPDTLFGISHCDDTPSDGGEHPISGATRQHYNQYRVMSSGNGWALAPDIAARLKDLRDTLGWTQGRLGKEVGRGWKSVSEWERGVRPPSQTLLVTMAERHKWPVEIFAKDGPMPSTVVTPGVAPEAVTGEGEEIDRVAEWLTEDEDQLRTFLRDIPRTGRGMVGDKATVKAIRGAIAEAIIRDFLDKGKPVPEILNKVHREILEEKFK